MIAPTGAGLVARAVRLRKEDVYLLGGILCGEDHLASIHGDASPPDAAGRVVVTVLTTTSRAAELDAWLDDLAAALTLERLP